MTYKNKTPGDVRASHRGNIKVLAPLYTAQQIKAQAAISRRYHVSPPQARVIAELLGMGGAND